MKKKELLKEIAGVPLSIEKWVYLLSEVVVDKIEQSIQEEGWQEETQGGVEDNEGNPIEITVYRTKKTFDGKDIMSSLAKSYSGSEDITEFFKSDVFKSLPIWRPSIDLEIIGIPQFLYDREFKGKSTTNAAMITKQGIQKLGKVGKQPVISHISFKFNPHIPEDSVAGAQEDLSEEIKNTIKKDISTTIGHELLHAYQTFKQMEKGGASHFGPETFLNALAQHPEMKLNIVDDWRNFLHLVYLHLSFEINARVNELYYEMKKEGVSTKEDFLRVLKKSHILDEVKSLESFDAKQFMKDFKLPKVSESSGFIEQMLGDSLLKLELSMRGIDPTSEKTALQSLIKIWDVILQQGSEAMKKMHGVDIPMDNVPEKAKKDPYLFFKFFEKRFHKKAKKFKRKLYRLIAHFQEEDPLAKKVN